VEEGSAKKGKRNPSRGEPFGTFSLGSLILDSEKTLDMADEGYTVRYEVFDVSKVQESGSRIKNADGYQYQTQTSQ
jgi:hypothetical protein